MEFDLERVKNNVRAASTEELLDRATVYRAGLEPEALVLILEELRSRGVNADDVVAHEQSRGDSVFDESGTAQLCSRCRKPAVVREWGWHWMYGKIPIFPRLYWRCGEHRRTAVTSDP
jgi:hypothetical protein